MFLGRVSKVFNFAKLYLAGFVFLVTYEIPLCPVSIVWLYLGRYFGAFIRLCLGHKQKSLYSECILDTIGVSLTIREVCNMPLYVWWIIAAGLLYTIVVWWVRSDGELCPWFVGIFTLAFALDIIGTSLMARLQLNLDINLHSLLGLTALVIMGLHALWAWLSLRAQSQRAVNLFHRWSPWAWGLWMVALISGVIIHTLGPQLGLLTFGQWLVCVATATGFLSAIYHNTFVFVPHPDDDLLPLLRSDTEHNANSSEELQ